MSRISHNRRGAAKSVAVIGAGPAGLVTAKSLIERSVSVTVYERGNAVGGTWNWGAENGRDFLYHNLHINTSKSLTAFRGYPFPADTQPIPDHIDMANYLQSYAEAFGLLDHIRLRTEVEAVRRESATGRWTVRTSDNNLAEFDAVVICTGPFNRPSHVKAFQAFEGEYVHSATYREPLPCLGKRVCIVGAGNSAVDIASDICTGAEKVVLIARSPVNVVPHTAAGVNTNDISWALQARWIPSQVRRFIMRVLTRIVHGRMTDLGFRPLTRRVHPTISSTIVQDILFRRVIVKNGLDQIEGRTLHFVDGTSGEFDTLVAATGFITEFPFLPGKLAHPDNNRLDLFQRIVPPEYPGLFFVGMINIDTPINFACERQARWVAALLAEDAVLPSREVMRAAINSKSAWVAHHYGTNQRHVLQEESKIYYRELDYALKDAIDRRKKSGTRQDNAKSEIEGMEVLSGSQR